MTKSHSKYNPRDHSNLHFRNHEVMKWVRTPKQIWEDLSNEFDFTVDCCASHQNHLLPKYYTKEDNSLTKDWTGEIAYIHPMFDNDIPRFVKKAAETKNFTGVFLLPASTHAKYFHDYMYKKDNVEIRFLKKPKDGFRFGHDDGSEDQNKVGYIKGLMVVIFRNE